MSRAANLNVVLWLLPAILAASCRGPINSTPSPNPNPVGDLGAPVLDPNPVVQTVRVSPNLPPYRVVLTRNLHPTRTPTGLERIGWIDVFAGNSPEVLQRFEVEGADPDRFQTWFHTLDINFDGYQDLAVLYQAAAKGGRESYWLFDPGSGRYITNSLTEELKDLWHNGLTLDPLKKEIRVSLWTGVCLNSFQIYRIEKGHLVLMESEIHSPMAPGRCLVEQRKRINGELKLIETKERTHEVPASLREP